MIIISFVLGISKCVSLVFHIRLAFIGFAPLNQSNQSLIPNQYKPLYIIIRDLSWHQDAVHLCQHFGKAYKRHIHIWIPHQCWNWCKVHSHLRHKYHFCTRILKNITHSEIDTGIYIGCHASTLGTPTNQCKYGCYYLAWWIRTSSASTLDTQSMQLHQYGQSKPNRNISAGLGVSHMKIWDAHFVDIGRTLVLTSCYART